MTINEITNKAKEIKELEAMMKAISDELETLKDQLKAELTERETEELQADIFTIRYKELHQNRLDSKTLKKELPEVFSRYTTEISVKRFTIS